MAEKTPLAKWLDNKYLEWQTQEEERKTVIEFADYLGVNRSLLSYWMNGAREPSDENKLKIALKLGFEIYDILGKDRPNIYQIYVDTNWEKVPPEEQRRISKIIAKYTTTPLPNEEKAKTSEP
jgi:transcriptional regulator with XRE-family HTH domain